ncbi:hypothetical protein [Aliidongia dinghuensis]|nr:hypothetical protein [Aliidongia dinghuensis]
MTRSLFLAPLGRVLTLSLLTGLAACQTEPAKPVVSSSCQVERADFAAAIDRNALPKDQPGGADAYYAALRRASTDPGQEARSLSTDIDEDTKTVEHVTASFATLKACRFDRAEEIRSGVAGGSVAAADMAPLLAGEQASFSSEIALAQDAAQHLAQHDDMLRQVAGRLATAAPGTALKVARAAAAAPPPQQPYVATAAALIYAKPASTGARVASLRRLQRVQGPGGEAAPGWVQLTLNDGSAGYVESGVLRPVQPNASALKAAARADATRSAGGDPIAEAVLAAQVSLPQRQQALTSLIDASSEAMAQAFSLPLPATAKSEAPPVDESP